MPELPEVETVRAQLHLRLAGARILAVDVWRSGREEPSGEAFVKALVSTEIERVERRAKLLFWYLKDGRVLLAHLKMTGLFSFTSEEYERQKHDRIQFHFLSAVGEPGRLIWADMRQFGYLKLVSGEVAGEIGAIYGIEPLEAPIEMLADRLKLVTTRAVKTVLLDQRVIAGIGNIYADEACFRAGILPTRPLASLVKKERERLAAEVQTILRESLAKNGTSAHTFVDTAGRRGGFIDLLNVYGRKGKPCVRCLTSLTKVTFRGRGTHYCSHCQK